MKPLLILLCVGIFMVSCHQPGSVKAPRPEDSIQIVTLLKDVYRWHEKQAGMSDFAIIVKDSFQVAVDYDSLNRTLGMLKKTGYFSPEFIANYKVLADRINDKLTKANPKLPNEINFGFQDADPWTYSQDWELGDWRKFTITDYTATADSASLKWKIQGIDWSTVPYTMKFARVKGKWRVAYLSGFDIKDY